MLVAAALSALWTWGWTRLGFAPSEADTPELWAESRLAVSDSSVVFLGTSRALSALDPAVWREVWPERPAVHLGLPGTSPEPLLRELAQDSSFAGVAVVGFAPSWIFDLDEQARRIGLDLVPARSAARALRSSPALRWEARIHAHIPPGLVLHNPALRWLNLLAAAANGRLPTPPHLTVHHDRFRAQRYAPRTLSPEAQRRFNPADPERALAVRDTVLRALQDDIQAIQAHGGFVAFVKIPTCDSVRAAEERGYPRARYWNVARERIRALFLDRRDSVLRREWHCADQEHMEAEDAPAFTRAIARFTRDMVERTSPHG